MTTVASVPAALADDLGDVDAIRLYREALVEQWEAWLRGTGLADATKTAYVRQVRRALDWIAEQPEHNDVRWVDYPHRRDYAVRDYKRHLLLIECKAPATANLALSAIDSLCTYVGLPPAKVARAPLAKRAPKALTEPEVRRVLRAAEQRAEVATPRDYGLVYLLLNTGLRISEARALNLDDVQVTARTGRVLVRAGKGDRPREVPLGPKTRPTFADLLRVRRSHHPAEPAVFINHSTGRRLAVSTLDYIIREIGKAAGLEQPLSAHTLRHTFGTRLVRGGVDLVTVADLMGHASIETTRRYALPDAEALEAAVEVLHVDH